ncbi:MAG: rsbU 7 [Bacteroidetes bacterium]|nr:rsbU 7 [Bacteroidota bacterium]
MRDCFVLYLLQSHHSVNEIIKRPNVLCILIVLLLGACRQQVPETPAPAVSGPVVISTNGFVVPADSIVPPEVSPAGMPESLPVIETHSSVTTTNTRAAGEPVIVPPGKAYIARPGTAIFSSPETVAAHADTFPCIQPQPLPAMRPRFKDDATCNIQYLDVDQGLPSSYIYKVYEDKFGNLWLSSSTGLVKYNGRSFSIYGEKQGFVNSTVKAILQDRNGDMWFGTGKGVFQYDGNSFIHYRGKEGKEYESVRSITEDKNGDLWFGTGAGICRFDKKTFTCYSENEGLVDNSVNSIFQDSKGSLWVATEGGVSRFDGKCFFSYTKAEGLNANRVISIAEDHSGKIWMGTEGGGACVYDGAAFLQYTDKQGLINNTVRKVLVDREGNIWLTAYHGGVSKFDGKTFTYFTEKEGLSLNTVWGLLEDQSGNIWMGTDGGGLCKYSARSFTHFTEKQGLNNVVINLSEDASGNIWMGTYGSGLCKYDGRSFSYYIDKAGKVGAPWCSLRDKDGNMWFGGDGAGVVKYDGRTFFRYTQKQGLAGNNISNLFQDKSGAIWIGMGGLGLDKFDGRSFTHYTHAQGLAGNDVKGITQDDAGNIWIATSRGVSRLNGSTIVNFTEREGLSNNNVRNILKDSKGNIWIGTLGGGLNKYDGKSLTAYTQKEGLSNNFIRSIVEDKPENLPKDMTGLWLSTDSGIDHLLMGNVRFSDTDTCRQELKIVIYKREDGLKGEDFCSNSGFQDSKGRLWWGSVKDLTMLDARTASIRNEIPKLSLENIILQQQFVDFRSLEDSIRQGKSLYVGEKNDVDLGRISFSDVPAYYNYPTGLELPYDINNITFNFSAADWNSPHRIIFQYILEGADHEWNPETAEAKAVYTNLPRGSYVFKVKVKGASGIWSEPIEYSFVIHPPWWQTIWAYLLYAAAFIVGAFLFFKWRTKALVARQRELEQTIVERTADVVQEKNKVTEKNEIIGRKQKEILDSITYAQRIQYSLLANDQLLQENLPEHFVLFRPKDIVSGDFYWATKKDGRFYLAVCDSTGHGVPGAFMSLLNISFLNEAVNEKNITEPHKVLNHVREQLIRSMEGGQDGMDATLICFEKGKLSYASAHNKPVLVRNGEVIELPADKMPVGKGERMESFALHTLDVQKNDVLYLFTDGYADQFGGAKGKKFKYRQMHTAFISIANEPMQKQHELLDHTFQQWRGELEQVDDICIIGVRF